MISVILNRLSFTLEIGSAFLFLFTVHLVSQ